MDISHNYSVPSSPTNVTVNNAILNTPNPPPVVRQPATLHLQDQSSNFSDVQRQLIFE